MDYDAFGYANRLRVSTTQDREEKFVRQRINKVFKLVGSKHNGFDVYHRQAHHHEERIR
mgnify:FL=1